jgi:hypothetical protein
MSCSGEGRLQVACLVVLTAVAGAPAAAAAAAVAAAAAHAELVAGVIAWFRLEGKAANKADIKTLFDTFMDKVAR